MLMRKNIFPSLILCLTCAAITAQANPAPKQSNVKIQKVAQAVAQAVPQYTSLNDLLQQQFDLKKQQLQENQRTYGGTRTSGNASSFTTSFGDALYTSIIKPYGIAYFRKQTYTTAQIKEIYFAQELPAAMKWVGEYLEKEEPETMIQALNTLRNRLNKVERNGVLPRNQAMSFSFEETYLFVWALIEANKRIEDL